MRDHQWIRNTLIAHRGFHSEDHSVPENSLTAFRLAIDKNYGIELDINVLRDGTVVVFHDKDLKRMTGRTEKLQDVDFEAIQAVRLLATEEKIPTLKEVLDLVDGKVPLLIELKHHGDSELLCRSFMKDIRDYKGKWAIHSFHPKILIWFKKYHPEVIRGQISEYFRDETDMKRITKYLLKTLKLNFLTKPDFINYGLRDMPNKYLDRAMKKGLTVIGYAAKNQEELDFVRSHYHNAVFEYFEPKP
ncbi:MAG: glycerophosphodiester phosphodiesterase [Bacilli bacterium]|nr:glycerophosphodiester phosphodiesterase [Bacilli bacterium]